MAHRPTFHGRDRPWLSEAGQVVWLDDDGPAVRFTARGVERLEGGQVTAMFPWSRIRHLSIEIPYTPAWVARFMAAATLLSSAKHGPVDVHIGFESGYQVVRWRLAQRGHCYSWRLQFLLDDLLHILNKQNRHFAVLADPEVLNTLAGRLAGSLRPWARALLYVDLFGLDRFLGGHGSRDRELHEIISRSEGAP